MAQSVPLSDPVAITAASPISRPWGGTAIFATLSGLIWGWIILLLVHYQNELFESTDGVVNRVLMSGMERWGKPLSCITLDPTQSTGPFYETTADVWLDPAWRLIALLGLKNGKAIIFDYLFDSICFTAATVYFMGCFKIDLRARLVMASLIVACLLPPGTYWFGIFPMTTYRAEYLITGGCFLLMVTFIFKIFEGDATCGRLFGLAVLGALPISYACYHEPLWTTIFLMTYFVMMGLCVPGWFILVKQDKWKRMGACALLVFTVLVLGGVFYDWFMLSISARVCFPSEIYAAEAHIYTYSYPLRDNNAFGLFIFMILGQSFLVAFARGLVRWFGIGQLLCQFIQIIFMIFFIYFSYQWNYPIPAYPGWACLPVYLASAGAGWFFAGQAAVQCSRWRGSSRQMIWGGLAPILILFLGAIYIHGVKPHLQKIRDAQKIMRENDAEFFSSSLILDHLEKNIGLDQTGNFRGRVANYLGVDPSGLAHDLHQGPEAPFSDDYQSRLHNALDKSFGNSYWLASYWSRGIPTLEQYTQLISPTYYFLNSRLFDRPQDYQVANHIFVSHYDPKSLELMGVRYVVTDAALTDLSAKPVEKIAGTENQNLILYELPDPNLGDYSPTEVRIVSSSVVAVKEMALGLIDYRKTVLCLESRKGNFVPAKTASFYFDRDGLHIRASSEGSSLLVMPVEYSHCWKVHLPSVQLFRADVGLLGVEFKGTIDALLTYEYGFWNYTGRMADMNDTKKIGLVADHSFLYPDQKTLAPHHWH